MIVHRGTASCESFKNNPVDIQDHEALQEENSQNCWNDGFEDAKADKPFNKIEIMDVMNTILIT
jgi:hypothetical protein